MISNLSSKPFVVKRPKSKITKTERDSNRSIPHFSKDKSPKQSLSKSPRSFNLPQSHCNLSKMIPKNIIYDKQTLYYEVRELKRALNKVMDENTKLKTRIAISSHDKQKINRSAEYECIEEGYGYRVGYTKKQRSRPDLQNIKIIREMQELRHRHDKLQTQMKHMKKTIKYTQIQQLELQVKILMEENVNLYRKNQNLIKEVEQYKEIVQDYHCLKNILGEKSKEKQEYISRIQDLSIEVMGLESQLKKMQEKGGRERREQKKTLSHDGNGQKDNMQSENIRGVDDKLRGNGYRTHHFHVQPIKTMRRQQFFSTKLVQRQKTPQHLPKSSENIEKTQSPEPSPNKKDSRYSTTKKKDLHDSPMQNSISIHKTNEAQTLIKESAEVKEINNYENEKALNEVIGTEKHVDEVLQEQVQGGGDVKQKQTGSQNGNGNHYVSETDKIFQKISDSEVEEKQHRSQQNFGYSFMAHHPQNIESESPPNPLSVLPRTNPLKDTFTPNSKTLKEIKTFLTYRFMFQKYSFSSLKKDIQRSPAQHFTYNDLCFMMVNEPFFLNVDYSLEVIKFILERGRPNQEHRVEKSCLIMKLGEVIANFKEVSFQQESKIAQKCSEVFKTHENVLRQLFFEAGKKSKNTVSHGKLIDILSKCELTLSEIQFLVAQTSIYSQDLQHLNYQLLFDRFLTISSEQQRREMIVERIEEQNQTLGVSNHEKVHFGEYNQKKPIQPVESSSRPILNSERIQERQEASLPHPQIE